MAGKFARSWELVKASADVLKQERKLLVFPLLSGMCCLLVMASFAAPVYLSVAATTRARASIRNRAAGSTSACSLFYLVQYTVIFFFNTALVGAAHAVHGRRAPDAGRRPGPGDLRSCRRSSATR